MSLTITWIRLRGSNSGFTLSNTDNVTVTAEDSSAQNHLKYSLAYVNGNEPSLPGTFPFYLKELSYFVSEGSSGERIKVRYRNHLRRWNRTDNQMAPMSVKSLGREE